MLHIHRTQSWTADSSHVIWFAATTIKSLHNQTTTPPHAYHSHPRDRMHKACLAPTRNENTPTRSAICYTAKPCGAIINWRTPACVSTRHTSTKQPRSTDDEMFITQVQRQPATRADTSTNASDEHGNTSGRALDMTGRRGDHCVAQGRRADRNYSSVSHDREHSCRTS